MNYCIGTLKQQFVKCAQGYDQHLQIAFLGDINFLDENHIKENHNCLFELCLVQSPYSCT